jgi:3-hydroxybutyryl-CoA dehydrogenase
MGGGIAACSALAGNPTVLIDLDLERAEKGRANALAAVMELAENGLADAAAAEKAEDLITVDTDYAKYADTAALVIEAVVENVELKQKVFAALDDVFPPEVPLLSNTSGLRITDIARDVKHPERTLTAHFWFPAHLVPLVEVVVGDRSSPELAEEIKRKLCGWGKAAIVVRRDLPGQLANRILQAVIREAVNIVDIGLASAEDVDTAVKAGMGIRLPAWGPFEHVDAVGLDLCVKVQRTVLP